MTRRTIIRMILAVLLGVYLVVAIGMTRDSAASRPFTSVIINVQDSLNGKFVNAADINAELEALQIGFDRLPRGQVNTMELENSIASMDKVEWANCVILNDGSLRIDVVPMIPIARVFGSDGSSYYINREGKRFVPTLRYRADVPVVMGDFDGVNSVQRLIPVLQYIKATPEFDALVSAINIDNRTGDIFVIPTIAGHVVNMGDTADIANKWERLRVFYKKVMPVRGWNFYDTISVKWRRQVVGTRAQKRAKGPSLESIMKNDTVGDSYNSTTDYQFLPPTASTAARTDTTKQANVPTTKAKTEQSQTNKTE